MYKEVLKIEMDLLKIKHGDKMFFQACNPDMSDNVINSASDSSYSENKENHFEANIIGSVDVYLDDDKQPFITDRNDLLDQLDQIRNILGNFLYGDITKCGKKGALELAREIKDKK